MIIESLLNLIIKLFIGLLSFIDIPEFPEDVIENIDSTLSTIIDKGSSLIDLVIPYDFAKALLLIVISIEIAIPVYHFVVWVLKKIPMLSIR